MDELIELLPLHLLEAFSQALKGERGELDAWLEVNNEADVRLHVDAYARACVAHATAAKDAEIEALSGQLAKAQDGWRMANGTAELAMKHRHAAEARAEKLTEAGRRVTAAFRAHGEATPFTREAVRTRHECEAAMLALDDALIPTDAQENDDA